jgi:signal transduction histidine kinase
VLVALVVQAGIVASSIFGPSANVPLADAALGLLFAALGPIALIGARRAPGVVVVVVVAVAVADSVLGSSVFSSYPAALLALALAAARGAQSWALASAATGWLAMVFGAGLLGIRWDPVLVAALTAGALVALGFGSSVRTRRERLAQWRAMQGRRRVDAAQQERVRIARELHDVLAHSLSSINVQAGVGLHLIESRPEKAAEALASIKTTSKQALDEVREVLGILRGEQRDDADAPLVPEADLESLPRLIEGTRSDTLDVVFASDLDTIPSAAVQLALYRITQESLTNIVRHSGATRARVDLAESSEGYVLRVTDNGRGAPDGLEGVAGKGLLGMRERAELLGGRLEVGAPDAQGGDEQNGFVVIATIPRR